MELSEIQRAALARWNELGSLTPANPVLALAYEQYLSPIGLKCGGLSYDALAALEDETLQPTVTTPVFDVSLVDRKWSQFPVVEPLLPLLDRLCPVFDHHGALQQFAFVTDDAQTDPAVLDFQERHADNILELSQNLVYCTKTYIDGALEALIVEDPASETFCNLFLKNPRQYAEAVWELFVRAGTATDENSASQS